MKSAPPTRVEKTETGLAFFGVIDHQSIPGLIRDMPELNSAEIELDLSATRKIDSAGLAFLIHWGNLNLAADQKVILRGAGKQVQQLIDIMRLKSIFELRA